MTKVQPSADRATRSESAVVADAARSSVDLPALPHRRPRTVLLMPERVFRNQFGAEEIAQLRAAAIVPEPIYYSDWTEPEARAALAEAEALITSWGAPRLDEDLLRAAPKVRAVFHAAGTVRSLVTDALWDRGVRVTSCADVNAEPVTDFTLAAIIMAGKKAPFMSAAARTARNDWSQYRGAFGPMTNLDRTIGIIGYSKIGRRVVARLQSLRATVLVYDPIADPEAVRTAGAEPVSLDDLLRSSDVISVHAPQLPSTYRMLGADQLALIGDHATVINTARGSLIDTAALERECASGRLNAILDVTDPEPLPADSVLYDLPNVMLTPHVAGSMENETRLMSRRAITELERYAQGLRALGAVAPEQMAVIA